MKTSTGLVVFLFMISVSCYAQTIHEIPDNSGMNYIELTICNDSGQPVKTVSVEAKEYPAWIEFNEKSETLTLLKSGEEKNVVFPFRAAAAAPSNEPAEIKFVISAEGIISEKIIMIKILPPSEFALYQNYPNPFNPETTIKFSIPGVETTLPTGQAGRRVVSTTLRIYDMLGREVETLVNESKLPGNYEVKFDGINLASGFYIYRLVAGDYSASKKMLLVK